MGNDLSQFGPLFRDRHSSPRFGSSGFQRLYGNGSGRRREISLSSKSSSQVEDAKEKFNHFVFNTDFEFMPESAKLKKEIFGHITKDARNAVRQHVTSMNAKCVFRADKQRWRGQQRVFSGAVTITPSTKPLMFENDAFREVMLVSELALCSFLCSVGIPPTAAKGWILDDVGVSEFQEIKDINHIKQYLTQKAVIWKKPIHCTEYAEFKGRKPKDLKTRLKNRNLGIVTDPIKKSNQKKGQKRNLDHFWSNLDCPKPSKRRKLNG